MTTTKCSPVLVLCNRAQVSRRLVHAGTRAVRVFSLSASCGGASAMPAVAVAVRDGVRGACQITLASKVIYKLFEPKVMQLRRCARRCEIRFPFGRVRPRSSELKVAVAAQTLSSSNRSSVYSE